MSTAKILIVDDEPRICSSLESLLKSKNYEVITTDCGGNATTILANLTFDVAIVDVHLPDMAGTQLMGHVRTNHPDTIIILITGDADVNSALAALRNGAYDYIKKPFEADELLNTVENALSQKKLKQEKEQINQQLNRSEEKYRYLVQNSPDIIYSLDANGHFTFLSEAVKHTLGFSADALAGEHYSAIIATENIDKAKAYFSERRFRRGASAGIELLARKNVPPKENAKASRTLPVELKSITVYEKSENGKEKFVGTHGVIRDISDRIRLQDQLRNAERMESLGTLAGGIAHDFNNLLMGIQGRTTLVSMDLDGNSPHLEHLQAIDEYIQSAKELTNQLLGFARRGKYEVQPTDINELILKSVRMFGRTKKEIIIETKFQEDNTVVDVDRGQIEQVLLNLYVNAWQAMPEGGKLYLETKRVEVKEPTSKRFRLAPGNYVQVLVKDTGIGMNQQTLLQIFDPFFTTKEKNRGTGLGLASAYGIIKNHGGYIYADSRIGCGATFTLLLPVSEKRAVTDVRAEKKVHTGSETILLVDDEELVLHTGKALLEKLGYHIIDALDGNQAVDIVRQLGSTIDLVILDMIMPGTDGGKVFDCIRKMNPEIPVLLSSGYAVNGQADKILNKGCKGFIQKPFTVSQISEKIREIFCLPVCEA
jgi:PAS domain S-box-containing protein